MDKQYLTFEPTTAIDESIDMLSPDRVLIVTDSNVRNKVFPLLSESNILQETPVVEIPIGEDGKNLETAGKVWEKLEEIGATRNSVVLNIGGGVVTDLGGFAASTFKRGIRTVNFPTTLLGAVDAATGGKTGINFKGLKNEIGSFHQPSRVIISPLPFSTLPDSEILSGYAEMVKTGLISDRDLYIRLLDIDKVLSESNELGHLVEKCVRVKEEVVAQDPHEQGLRKILNFGHTAGHAIESLCLSRDQEITHGKAVAHGMLVALILSHIKLGFNSGEVDYYRRFLRENYGLPPVGCKDTDILIGKMKSDKKNRNYGQPLFTLLKDIGAPQINVEVEEEEIREALEIMQGI
ncbi:MAG: 3-dehydroquinate synthase [Muribaculaceae bacterium]|nr:3-dehydroquinate synthase [Muribaculaceae bacterium]